MIEITELSIIALLTIFHVADIGLCIYLRNYPCDINNDKLVIAPRMWFGINGPKFNIQDIYQDAIFI